MGLQIAYVGNLTPCQIQKTKKRRKEKKTTCLVGKKCKGAMIKQQQETKLIWSCFLVQHQITCHAEKNENTNINIG